jgi:hemerythrin
MPLMNWKPEFSVGIGSIDAQHTKLISLINNLHEAMNRGEGKAVVGTILTELIQYTKTHFAFEEELFKKHAYAGYAKHKAAHDALTGKVLDLHEQFKSGKSAMTIEVMTFLKNWLQDHILVTDKAYSAYLVGKGVK